MRAPVGSGYFACCDRIGASALRTLTGGAARLAQSFGWSLQTQSPRWNAVPAQLIHTDDQQ
jgi:hypothetical protein